TNTGAILAPLIVPAITLRWGWQWAFIATGALGFVWLVLWIPFYHDGGSHPRVSPEEVRHIRSDTTAITTAGVPWVRLLGFRQTWAYAVAKLLTDPVWFFY